ncbi:MAG: molybdenum cofactor biosynthesis protein B [Chlamydiales bacterium]|jgi:molybdenum cofactor biosynthesis protein B
MDNVGMSVEEHRGQAPARIGFGVLTVSDTRQQGNDPGGDYLVRALEEAGHDCHWRELVPDEAARIRAALRDAVGLAGVSVLLVTGGTGIAPRDVTVPVLEAEFDSSIPGFGELFRSLSFAQIGSATILSRATAGLVGQTVVFGLPGSPKALELAMEEIILKEAGHLVSQVRG